MTRQQAIESLAASLTAAIDEWIENNCEEPAWESLDGYVSNDTSRLMSKAAMATLEAQIDVQDYLKQNVT